MSVFLPYSHALFNIRGADTVAKLDDKLGNLLDVDDILALGLVLIVGNDLGASGYL